MPIFTNLDIFSCHCHVFIGLPSLCIKKKGTKSSAGFRSSRCQHYFCRLLPPCCQVTPASAKQMCSSHCDRWPILIMLIHNKKKERERLSSRNHQNSRCVFFVFFLLRQTIFLKNEIETKIKQITLKM